MGTGVDRRGRKYCRKKQGGWGLGKRGEDVHCAGSGIGWEDLVGFGWGMEANGWRGNCEEQSSVQ